jgi:hypothetical protein
MKKATKIKKGTRVRCPFGSTDIYRVEFIYPNGDVDIICNGFRVKSSINELELV